MKHRYSMLILLVVFALVAASCGDDGGETTTTAAAGATTTTTAGGGGETTTTASGGGETTTTSGGDSMEIATDVGVDLEAGTIKVGLLSDLSGPFAGLVAAVVAGQEAYWASVNAAGGINGLMVEPIVRDTNYEVPTHIALYEELKEEVVAFGHSTGSPHTVAINDQLQEDGILAIPLTWYSGWTDPALNANLIHHGVPYCIEAMNIIEWLTTQMSDISTIAIASLGGDYGLDSAEGARIAAAELGLEVVYDGAGAITGAEDLKPVSDAIVASGADLVFVTATSGTFGPVYQNAIAQGFDAMAWTGAFPTFSPAYFTSDFAEQFVSDWYGSVYLRPWGADTPGNAAVRDLMTAAGATQATSYYGEGVVEARIIEAALRKAYENGDMTQAGVLAAAKSIENLSFDGLAPDERYTGTANEQLQRVSIIYNTSLEDAAAGGDGVVMIEEAYTGDLAANFDFQEACFKLG